MPEGDPVVFSPETYARHDAAIRYINRVSRTRDPMGRRDRFPGIRAGAWGLLAAGGTITAASGLTLGSGTVKFCNREGTADDPEVSVDVANAGGTIDGGSTGAVLPMEWTEGEWSVCGCVQGEETVDCTPCPIPRGDRVLSWAGGSMGSGSLTLVHGTDIDPISGDPYDVWDGSGTFTFTGHTPEDRTVSFRLACYSGGIQFSSAVTPVGDPDTDDILYQNCTTLVEVGGFNRYEMPDPTCSPFHLHFTTFTNSLDSCGTWQIHDDFTDINYISDFYID